MHLSHIAGSAKLLMVLEAFFGGFYVAVTRNLFIPMLAYSGYSLQLLSTVTFVAAAASIAISYAIFQRPEMVMGRVKQKLLAVHALERVFWVSLPFMLADPNLMAVAYASAQATTILVGILLNVAMLSVFSGIDFVELGVKRMAANFVASILGTLFITCTTAILPPPESYYVAYVSAVLVGLSATVMVAMYAVPDKVDISTQPEPPEEVKIKKVNTFVFLALMYAGGNLVGIAWSPLLKKLGAPVYMAVALSLAASVGGIIGSHLWRGYRRYALAVTINSALTAVIPFVPWAPTHIMLSALATMTFIGTDLIAMSIYSKYVAMLGVVKASTLLTTANYLGLFCASLLGYTMTDPRLIFIVAAGFKFAALAVALLAIPETAIVPPTMAYEYGRLIYSSSVIGYTLSRESLKQAIRLALEALAFAILITLLYFIYRLATLILGA